MDSICDQEYLLVAYRVNNSSAKGRLWAAAGEQGAFLMLDIIYLLIGAIFLGGCVLYAIACDHL